MGLLRWLWWLIWRPKYEIVSAQSFTSAENAARSAQIKTNAAGGEAIGIAADAICCGGEEGNHVEWDVYVLIKH